MAMTTHYRVIFPVGQGGFAFENIGTTSIVYDCGSISSPARLEMYIDCLKAHDIKQISYLFISHFDIDHVNGIQYLLSSGIKVVNAVMSAIPKDLRIVYNAATDGAYLAMRQLLERNKCEILEVNEETQQKKFSESNQLWEWIAKNMLSNSDLQNLQQELQDNDIDVKRLDDAEYLDNHKVDINNVFKTVFGPLGPNAKGLVVLSQKTQNAILDSIKLVHRHDYCDLLHCDAWYCLHYPYHAYRNHLRNTGCLYTGDTRIKTQQEIQTIINFLQTYCHEKTLGIMQLPHHGSKYNVHNLLHQKIMAELYFVHDNSDKRIKQSQPLYTDLDTNCTLHIVKDICADVILGETNIH